MYQSLPKKKKIQTNNKIQTIKTIRTIEKNRYKKKYGNHGRFYLLHPNLIGF